MGSGDRESAAGRFDTVGAADRRRARRIPVGFQVLLREDRFGTTGRTREINRHGGVVRTTVPLSLHAWYDFYLRRESQVFQTRARVVRLVDELLYALEFECPLPDEALEPS